MAKDNVAENPKGGDFVFQSNPACYAGLLSME